MEATIGHTRTAELPMRKRIIQTIFISAIYFIFGILRGQEGVVFLDLIHITNSDITTGSLMFTVSALGYVMGVLLLGVLYDKLNNDILHCTCAVITGVATLIIPWCESLTLMVAIFGIRSFFLGPADSGSSVICAKTWQLKAGPFLQNLQFLFAVGGIIAPFITKPFLLRQGYSNFTTGLDNHRSHLTNFTASNVSISSSENPGNSQDMSDFSVNITENYSSTILTTSHREVASSKVYLAFAIAGGTLLIFCVGFAVKILVYSSGDFDRFVESKKRPHGTRRRDPLASVTWPSKVICYMLLAVNCFSQGCVEKILMSYLMTFTVEYLTWSKDTGSLATTVFWTGFAGGRFLGIFLVKLLKLRTLLFVTLCGLFLTFVAMCIVDSLNGREEYWWVLIGASGLFLASMFAAYISWIDKSLTPVTGKLMSFVYVWLFVGTMTHMVLLGYLFEEFTPMWFVYLLIIHTVSLLVTFLAQCLFARKLGSFSPNERAVIVSSPENGCTLTHSENVNVQEMELMNDQQKI